jgi:hypothetical protein
MKFEDVKWIKLINDRYKYSIFVTGIENSRILRLDIYLDNYFVSWMVFRPFIPRHTKISKT